jgi:hypothetical protein
MSKKSSSSSKKKAASPLEAVVAPKRDKKGTIEPEKDFFWMKEESMIYVLNAVIKKDADEKQFYALMDLERWETYVELAVSILFLSFLSFLFTWINVYKWLLIVVLLVASAAIMLITIYSVLRRKQNQSTARRQQLSPQKYLNANTCGFIWLFWCVYSAIIANNAIPRANGIVAYLLAAIAYSIVMVTYQQSLLQANIKTVSLFFAAYVVCLVVPHEESVNFALDPLVYFAKLIFFFIVYVATEFELQLAEILQMAVVRTTTVTSMTTDTDLFSRFFFHLKKTQLVFIRTAWILFCPSWMTWACFVQFIPLYRQLMLVNGVYSTFQKMVIVGKTAPPLETKKKKSSSSSKRVSSSSSSSSDEPHRKRSSKADVVVVDKKTKKNKDTKLDSKDDKEQQQRHHHSSKNKTTKNPHPIASIPLSNSKPKSNPIVKKEPSSTPPSSSSSLFTITTITSTLEPLSFDEKDRISSPEPVVKKDD